ncbi:Ig-like domain-containing protein, partial [Ciceribacter sp. RN22]|uniref:beta strand repeat-containing protein n=1 Tax=Ciceribacter sp. RN22 TaxID=2954932 RepID=UPI0020936A51
GCVVTPPTGTAAADWLAGSDKTDTLTGGGGADVLLAFGGDDTINVSDTGFTRIDGGTGFDTLALDGSGIALDFVNSVAPGVVTNIEMIDIGGTGANSLTVDQQTVLDMSGTSDTVVIVGGPDDSVTATGFTPTGTTATLNGMTFNVYTNGPATVWIQQGVQVNGIATPVIAIDTPIAGDDIVNLAESTGVTITGTTTGVEAGQTVTVTLTDGTNTVTTTATVLPDGTWQATPADLSTLTDGPVDVAANVINAGGTPATDTAPVTLDTVASVTIDSVTDTDSDGMPEVTGTADPGSTVTITWPDGTQTTATADGSGNWTAESPTTQPEGTVTATATDPNGNISGPATGFYDVLPTITIGTPIEGDDIVNAAEAGDVVITGTTTDVPAGQTVTVTLTDGTNTVTTTATVLADGTWQAAPVDVSSLTDGPITVTADVSDTQGNPATDTAPAELDTTPPVATIEAMSNDCATYGDFVSAADVTEVSGSADPGSVVTISVDGTVIGTVTVDATGVWISPQIDLSGYTAGTTLTVTAEVTDAAGNTTTAVQDITTADPAPAGFVGIGTGADPVAPWTSGQGVYVGDFNGDGIDDNLFVNTTAGIANDILYLGTAGGGFTAIVPSSDLYLPWTSGQAVYVGDFNGDGIDDYVFANNDGSIASETLYLGTADGNFAGIGTGADLVVPWTSGQVVVVGDFNGDGIDDLLFVNTTAGIANDILYLGTAGGGFTAIVPSSDL